MSVMSTRAVALHVGSQKHRRAYTPVTPFVQNAGHGVECREAFQDQVTVAVPTNDTGLVQEPARSYDRHMRLCGQLPAQSSSGVGGEGNTFCTTPCTAPYHGSRGDPCSFENSALGANTFAAWLRVCTVSCNANVRPGRERLRQTTGRL